MSGFLIVAALWTAAVLAALIFGWHDRRQARASVRRYRAAQAEARLRHAVHTREQHPGTNQQLLADCQAIWNQPERRQQ